jgi:hypothetical protein
MLQKMKTLRGSLKVYAKRSRFDIPKENREHYHELASEAVMDIMSHPKSAGCLEMDPVGTEKLKYAKDLRDRIRQMLLYEFMDDAEAEKLVELAKEELAVGLYRPDLTLPDVMDVIAKG